MFQILLRSRMWKKRCVRLAWVAGGRRGPSAGLSLSSSSGEKPRSKTTAGWQHGKQPLALRAAEVAKPVPPCPSLPLPPCSTRCPELSPRCLPSLAQHNHPGPGHRWATAPCHHHQKRIFRMLYIGNCMFRSCILQRWDLTCFLSEKPQNRSEILRQVSRGATAPTHHSSGACSKDTQLREPAPGSGCTHRTESQSQMNEDLTSFRQTTCQQHCSPGLVFPLSWECRTLHATTTHEY